MATQLAAAIRLTMIDDVSGTARAVEAAMTRAASGSSAAVEDLRLKQLAASDAARTLAGELRRMQGSGKASDEQLREVSVALVRAREESARYAREAREVAASEREAAAGARVEGQALTATAAAASRASTATGAGMDRTRDAARGSSRAVAENINLFTELTLGLGALDPRIQQVAISFAGAGNNAFQLANFLGPIPLVIATIATALPALIGALRSSRTEMEGLGEAADRTEQSFEELVQRIHQMREAQQQEEAARRGELEVQDQEDRLAAARARVTASQQAVRETFGGRADAAELAAVVTEAARTGRDAGTVLREHAARGVAFGRVESQRSSTNEINLRNASMTITNAMRGQGLGELIGSQVQDERLVRELEGGLEQARARVQQEQQREAVRARPDQIRQQLTDLGIAQGLTGTQQSSLLEAASRGRAIPESILRRLGSEAARARDLAAELTPAEQAAARSRLEEATVEDTSFGVSSTPIAQVRQRTARRPAAAPVATAPTEPAGLTTAQVAQLERLAQPQRVEVRVHVEDARVHYDVVEASAGSSNLTGGQG